ncbi:hypothetical protein ACLOJK_027938 [Asimina triloba]
MATAQQMKSGGEQVLDGSDIKGLVENEEAFTQFVDHKFKELDVDGDGKLSVRELQPAVVDIGAALGLPAKGSSPDSDHIYDEVPTPPPPPPPLSLSLSLSLSRFYSIASIQILLLDLISNVGIRNKSVEALAPPRSMSDSACPHLPIRVWDRNGMSSLADIKHFPDAPVHGHGRGYSQKLKSGYAVVGPRRCRFGVCENAAVLTSRVHMALAVLSEFTRGKQEKVGKTEFKAVLSDILLGMAAGLKRDPIVILRIDGEDLLEFSGSTRFQPEAVAIFSQVQSTGGSLRDCITKALAQLSVDHGLPPSSDSWVFSNVIEPALQSCSADYSENPISQEVYLEEFNKVLNNIAARLKEQPVIVAHTENTFDGSGIKRLLSNKFELDKLLDAAVRHLPKDHHGKESKDYIRVALDEMAASAGLPPYGAVGQKSNVRAGKALSLPATRLSLQDILFSSYTPTESKMRPTQLLEPVFSRLSQLLIFPIWRAGQKVGLVIDAMVNEAIKMVDADDGKVIGGEEFKKLVKEILGSIMVQLEATPVSVSSSSVVHEPLANSSGILAPIESSTAPESG